MSKSIIMRFVLIIAIVTLPGLTFSAEEPGQLASQGGSAGSTSLLWSPLTTAKGVAYGWYPSEEQIAARNKEIIRIEKMRDEEEEERDFYKPMRRMEKRWEKNKAAREEAIRKAIEETERSRIERAEAARVLEEKKENIIK